MRIIVLEGPSNKGKTTTIGLVYEIILHHGGNPTVKQQLGNDPKDFKDIVTNYMNKKIGFFSMGDYSNELADAINYYAEENCDLLICALSIGEPQIRANNRLDNFKTTRINKTVVSDVATECRVNVMDSLIILGLV